MVRVSFLFFFLFLCASDALTAHHGHQHHAPSHKQFHHRSSPSSGHVKRADKVPLRILPLGASITWGLLSTSGNGYRKPLRDKLRIEGWEVDMVGTKTNGDMWDNEVEAHSGDTIDQVRMAAQGSLNYRPNVVLINAGTNDCRLEIDITQAGVRMRTLIESLLAANSMERTTIILSTLLPSTQAETAIHRPAVNAQYRSLVKQMQAEGVSIVLADMDPEYPDNGNGWIMFPDDFDHGGVVDSTHPNEEGYKKMAYVWYKAIMNAWDKGLLKSPNAMDSVFGSCEKQYGDGVYAGGKTQRGSGEEDGIYYHSSESMGIVLSVVSGFDRDQWFFARLFSRDRDDLLGWFQNSGGTVAYGTWRNTGDPSNMFVKIADTSVADNCIQPGVNFIDINGDGLDDFVCIGKDGTAYASVNQGDGTTDRPPSFRYIGKIKDPEGYPQDRVRLADVDGDGRADYCVIADNGDITCWRNGWIDDVPKYWQALGKRFTGKGMGDVNGVRFEDINGDGRDDWLWLDDVGQTTTYTNSRSCHKGSEGDGLNIIWRQAYAKGQSAGPTHYGMSGFGDKGLRHRVHFARVYGEPQDFGLLGKQDYVFMEHKEDNGKHHFNMRVWKNVGGGGTKIRADGNRYCNMLGHKNGMMDYVWILSKGDMHIYENAGLNQVADDGPSFWGRNYMIFDPKQQAIGRDLDRRDLHLADWDGDGKCDIVWTDPNNQNRPQVWLNRYQDGNFNWEWHSNPAPDLYCPEKRGLGFFDRPVHFADVSGNGKSDYLCVEKDGRAWGFVHNEVGTWDYIDQFKFSEGRDRANLHWADVDGDGKADMIHTNKFNGDGTVWLNKGRKDIGGSRYEWQPLGARYEGAVAGACTYFPDLDGNGRADMHAITNALANTAETWFSRCGRVNRQGDDGVVSNPYLPEMPTGSASDSDSDGGPDGGYDESEDTDGLEFTFDLCTSSYEHLDDLPDYNGDCTVQYILETMLTMLKSDLQNYTDILADDYDKKFKIYSEAVVDSAPETLHQFYIDNGTEYFNCIVTEFKDFCPSCTNTFHDAAGKGRCRYCISDREGGGYTNVTEPCPPDMSLRGSNDRQPNPFWQTTFWSFQNEEKEAQFYADLLVETGIPKDLTTIGIYDHREDPADCHVYPECYYKSGFDFNVPVVTGGYDVDDVANPKNIISDYLGKMGELQRGLEEAILAIRVNSRRSWSGDEMIDAVSMAVMSVRQSVDSMAQVVDIAEEIEAEKRKQTILLFLIAFLILIPIGGGAIRAIAGLSNIGRFIGLAGDAALVGLDLYTIVDDPSSAPFVIFGYILQAGALADAVKVNKAATARRSIKSEDVQKFGTVFAKGMTKIDDLMKWCK